jgi:hypothetical protein
MKLKSLTSLYSRCFVSGFPYENPSKAATSKYADSVTKKLVWINIDNFGKFERIAAFEGETMLDALLRFNMDNVPGKKLQGDREGDLEGLEEKKEN